jgi:hypothetical protein
MFQIRVKTSTDNRLCASADTYQIAQGKAAAIWHGLKTIGWHSWTGYITNDQVWAMVVNEKGEQVQILIINLEEQCANIT